MKCIRAKSDKDQRTVPNVAYSSADYSTFEIFLQLLISIHIIAVLNSLTKIAMLRL